MYDKMLSGVNIIFNQEKTVSGIKYQEAIK